MALEGFESTIGGKWILLRNERFDDYLGAMGMILHEIDYSCLSLYNWVIN